MQIIKKILFIFFISTLIIVGINYYQYSDTKQKEYKELGKQKFKEELVLKLKETVNSDCVYKELYKEVMTKKEFEEICIKN